jgi:glycine oxidase
MGSRNKVNIKVAVIGQGISGLSMAYRLLQSGFEVHVFGTPNDCKQASKAAPGVVCSKGLNKAASTFFAAKLEGQKRLKKRLLELEQLSGLRLITNYGVFEPYCSDEELSGLINRIYRSSDFQQFGTQLLARNDLLERISLEILSPEVEGALYYPEDYSFDATQILNAFRVFLQTRKVKFVDRTVRDITLKADGYFEIAVDEELVKVNEIVIAAGSEVQNLAAMVGLQIGIFSPVAGCEMVVGLPRGFSPVAMVHGPASLHITDDKLRFGSTARNDGDLSDEAIANDKKDLWSRLEDIKINLNLIDPNDVQIVTGVRCRSADREPVIGALQVPGIRKRVYVLAGLFKNGFQLADICAEYIEHLMSEKSTENLSLAKTFTIDRFS